MKIRCIRYQARLKGTLVAEADIVFEDVGLLIEGVLVHEKNGKRWLSFPAFRELGPGYPLGYQPGSRAKPGDPEFLWVSRIKFVDEERKLEFREEAKAAVARFLCQVERGSGTAEAVGNATGQQNQKEVT